MCDVDLGNRGFCNGLDAAYGSRMRTGSLYHWLCHDYFILLLVSLSLSMCSLSWPIFLCWPVGIKNISTFLKVRIPNMWKIFVCCVKSLHRFCQYSGLDSVLSLPGKIPSRCTCFPCRLLCFSSLHIISLWVSYFISTFLHLNVGLFFWV